MEDIDNQNLWKTSIISLVEIHQCRLIKAERARVTLSFRARGILSFKNARASRRVPRAPSDLLVADIREQLLHSIAGLYYFIHAHRPIFQSRLIYSSLLAVCNFCILLA